MEGKIQTSFIPKKPVVETKARGGPTTNIFSMIAWFIFIVALATSIAVYFYENYLNKQIDATNADLTNITSNFNSASIDHFAQLDARLKTAKSIMDSHLAFSALLKLIGNNTIQSIQFTSLKYSYNTDGVTLSLKGLAPDFTSVALQSDKLSKLSYFKDSSFSGVALDTSGNVVFNFMTNVDLPTLRYLNVTSAANANSNSTSSSTDKSNLSN